MKCCEDVILTVHLHPGDRALDMELPAFLPVSELGQRFLDVVREMDPMRYGAMSAVSFRKNNCPLEHDTTLAKAGLWDGSFLDAYLSGEG